MKKLLSVFMAIAMVFGMAMPMSAFAEEDAISVQFSVCDGGMFTLEPQSIEVDPSLSTTYAEFVGTDDNAEAPTLLDAIISAHITMFGEEDFIGLLEVSSSGWITSAFGEGSNCGFRINGEMAMSAFDTIKDDDFVEFYFYQDAYWGDKYVAFDQRSVEAEQGSKVTLNVIYEGYDSSWNTVTLPAGNLSITTLDGESVGTTDENGSITIDAIEDMKLTAEGTIDYSPIFLPYCEIDVKNYFRDELSRKIELGGKYIAENGVSTSLSNAFDTYGLFRAGVADEDKFLTELNANLKANEGKIVVNDSESVVTYACVIDILDVLGYNPANYEGYDIAKAFENCESKVVSNPYYYRAVVEACVSVKANDMAKAFCDEFIENYYVMGKGMNYWGFSCDNTAVFLTAIAPCKDDYKAYVDDAKKVLEHYITCDGCFYSDEYTDISPDSTATALMAYASLGENDKVAVLYNQLMTGFEDEALEGVLDYYGAPNAYSTKSCVVALTYINEDANHIYDKKSSTKPTCQKGGAATYACRYCDSTISISDSVVGEHSYKDVIAPAKVGKNGSVTTKCSRCGDVKSKTTISAIDTITLSKTSYVYDGKAKKPIVTVKNAKGTKLSASNYTVKYSANTNVGTAKVTITFKGKYSGTVTKSYKILPKGTSISSLTPTKKGFKVAWNKQAKQITGYQIQFAENSSFTQKSIVTNVAKPSAVSKSFSKLTGNKKYYVRIRTYKVIGNNYYFSSWSSTKAVTTKK